MRRIHRLAALDAGHIEPAMLNLKHLEECRQIKPTAFPRDVLRELRMKARNESAAKFADLIAERLTGLTDIRPGSLQFDENRPMTLSEAGGYRAKAGDPELDRKRLEDRRDDAKEKIEAHRSMRAKRRPLDDRRVNNIAEIQKQNEARVMAVFNARPEYVIGHEMWEPRTRKIDRRTQLMEERQNAAISIVRAGQQQGLRGRQIIDRLKSAYIIRGIPAVKARRLARAVWAAFRSATWRR